MEEERENVQKRNGAAKRPWPSWSPTFTIKRLHLKWRQEEREKRSQHLKRSVHDRKALEMESAADADKEERENMPGL